MNARYSPLDATLDFTVTDLEPGSTIFGIDAPQLRDTACEQFAQTDLWGNRPPLEDTALDLAAQAINELQSQDPAGDYFDRYWMQFSSSGPRPESQVFDMR